MITGLLNAIRVAERCTELGMLRAIGATRLALLGLILGEVVLLGMGGGVVGVGVAWAGLALAVPDLTSAELLWPGLGALGLTLAAISIAGLVPALKAAAMDPLEAARRT